MMRDDDNPPDAAIPRPGTLPPGAKTLTVLFDGLERLGKVLVLPLALPMLPMLAVKWGLLDAKEGGFAFLGVISTVLGGHFALRKAEQQGEK